MASLNKHSLREEIDTLMPEFERLCTDGTLVAEGRALFQTLLQRLLLVFSLLLLRFIPKKRT